MASMGLTIKPLMRLGPARVCKGEVVLQPIKNSVRNAIRARGWDLVKTPNLNQFLASRDVDLVIDVGANDGGFASSVRRWGYAGTMLSIEPTTSAFTRLKPLVDRDRNWEALKLAVGAENGEADIFVSEWDTFSSFLPQTKLADNFDERSQASATETVQVRRLDDLLRERSFQRAFLKIDVQGFEKQVLAGAAETLARSVGVQLELPIGRLYAGVWSFIEGLQHMDTLGFVLAQNVPTNTFGHDRASAIEFDCIFRRKDERDEAA